MITLNLNLFGTATTVGAVTTIPSIAGAGSSVAITKVSATDHTVSSINFTCGASTITYPFAGFDARFIPSATSVTGDVMSYIEFTSNSTGIQHLGNSVNADNSINLPFTINESNLKNIPDYYLSPLCSTQAASPTPFPILETLLDSINSCCHFVEA